MGRGGRRPGAGRKPAQGERKKSITLYVSPEVCKISAHLKAAGFKLSRIFEDAIIVKHIDIFGGSM